MGAPGKGQRGSPDPPGFRHKIFPISLKGNGLNFRLRWTSNDHNAFSFGRLSPRDHGLYPWAPLGALPPDTRYRLVFRTHHGAPQPLTPSAAYGPLLENPVGAPAHTSGGRANHSTTATCIYFNITSQEDDIKIRSFP